MYAALIEDPTLEPPFVTLIVSGGHTLLIAMDDHGRYRVLGRDRRRRGGRGVRQGRALPRARLSRRSRDRPARRARAIPRRSRSRGRCSTTATTSRSRGSRPRSCSTCASIPTPTSPTSRRRSRPRSSTCSSTKLLARRASRPGSSTVVIGGGVAANSALRERAARRGRDGGLRVVLPSIGLVHRQRGDGRGGRAAWRLAADGPTSLASGAYPALRIGRPGSPAGAGLALAPGGLVPLALDVGSANPAVRYSTPSPVEVPLRGGCTDEPAAVGRPDRRPAGRGRGDDHQRPRHPRHRQGEAAAGRGPGGRSGPAGREQWRADRDGALAVGDTVVYSKYGGTEITVDGEDVLILSSRDVLAKVGRAPRRSSRRQLGVERAASGPPVLVQRRLLRRRPGPWPTCSRPCRSGRARSRARTRTGAGA